jgi:hypothetical protein
MSDEGPNFAIHSWGDVMAVVSVTGALFAGIIWGLKLESRINVLRERLYALELRWQPKRKLLDDEE